MILREEFTTPDITPRTAERGLQIAELFSQFLTELDKDIPPGRERALVITKLQEAAYFAKRAIAVAPNTPAYAQSTTATYTNTKG